ncbi:MAG: hypothetical protein K5821_06950 [Nitrobacter sp.]|uniref:hypothetical protein n=1 Tax=Nitrobacter sp. TaxID=29420 RepID=UPI0026191DD7|nr:hypothetical protein [Nitrobacter sp.]MCV0386156.1 hypothetical protein [Nitrobacter sp.]
MDIAAGLEGRPPTDDVIEVSAKGAHTSAILSHAQSRHGTEVNVDIVWMAPDTQRPKAGGVRFLLFVEERAA